MQFKSKKFATLAIHAGSDKDQHHALNPPLYLSSTFTFDSVQQADDTFSFKRKSYVYTRGGNPTINLLERRVAALENGIGAVAFSSGMAAITGVLLSLLQQGDYILSHQSLYGSTYSAIKQLFAKFGINSIFVDFTDINSVKNALENNSSIKVLYFETPSNPVLEIINIAEIVKLSKKHNVKVVIDNTFATPYLQNPLDLGADIVVHSATKYLCGHGDVLGGIAIAQDEEYLAKLKFGIMCELGSVLSPFDAWLILRGIKTLELRMERHCNSAQKIAEFLSSHKNVTKVIYPGLKSHPQYELASKQMLHFGGILSFEIDGDENQTRKCIEKMQLAQIAVSLGDAETLVEAPALMTHRSYSVDDLQKAKFSNNTIRISVGLENCEDIIADLNNALTF